MNIKQEIDNAFKDYIFIEKGHQYIHTPSNKNLKSVTTFLSGLKEAFNVEFWSTLKAFEFSGYSILKKNEKENYFIIDDGEMIIPGETNVNSYYLSYTPKKITEIWNITKHIGLNRGTYLHKLLEDLEVGKEEPNQEDFYDTITKNFMESEKIFIEMFPLLQIDLVEDSFSKIKNLGKLFLKENKHLKAIEIERLVGDETINLAGTFDRLYYNNNSNQFEIWDFKTDKKIKYSNKYSKLSIFNLDDCEYNKYSLQTSLYKYIIEKNTPVVLGDSYIVHFSHENNKYETIKAEDYTKLIKEKFEDEYNRPTYL